MWLQRAGRVIQGTQCTQQHEDALRTRGLKCFHSSRSSIVTYELLYLILISNA